MSAPEVKTGNSVYSRKAGVQGVAFTPVDILLMKDLQWVGAFYQPAYLTTLKVRKGQD